MFWLGSIIKLACTKKLRSYFYISKVVILYHGAYLLLLVHGMGILLKLLDFSNR
uniref:Uncharacterized protein n=1 Tax=Arundo donax TaxID=35708 RepID=A0A0A8Y8L3_ARUDO